MILNSVVKLKYDVEYDDIKTLKKCMMGTIVDVYNYNNFEVEFLELFDDPNYVEGDVNYTVYMMSLTKDALELV